MTEPTPGPWMLHDMEAATVVTAEKPGLFIAACRSRSHSGDTNHANALLIAAAPEMYDLIAATGDAIADVFEQMNKGKWIDDHGHDVQLNRGMLALKDRLIEAIDLRAPFVKSIDTKGT